MRTVDSRVKTMAVDGLVITEQWIRDKLKLQHTCLADVRSLALPGTYEGKICHLGSSLRNFVHLKTLDLSHNKLITIKGIEHLEVLETLNLYYNRLGSVRDVFTLHKLQSLKELDLRLNPVVKRHPHYRLYLIHAMSKLRKLDDCPVRDRERKAALLHFLSDSQLDLNHKKHALTQDTSRRSSEVRIKAVERMMKTLSLLEANDEAVLNEVCRKHQTVSTCSEQEHSPQLTQENSSDVIHLLNGSACEGPAIQNQDLVHKKSDHKSAQLGACVHTRQGVHRVTFGTPVVKSCYSVRSLTPGQSSFTPHPTHTHSTSQEDEHRALNILNQPENNPVPVLHPPRLTFRSPAASERKHCRGVYRKPMELLLGLLEESWSEKKDNEQDRKFLMKMVQILTLMEKDIVAGEEEIQTLKETVQASNTRIEVQEKHHRSEMDTFKITLQQAHKSVEALSEQLKVVLEENVSLQKQLIRAEEKLLSSRLKKLPDMQDRGEEMNKPRQRVQEPHRAKEPAHRPQEDYRSLIGRNECLLQELEEALNS